MLNRSKYLAQHKKDGYIVTIEWNRIISPAEHQIFTDQLNDMHHIDAEKKPNSDKNIIRMTIKKNRVVTKIALLY